MISEMQLMWTVRNDHVEQVLFVRATRDEAPARWYEVPIALQPIQGLAHPPVALFDVLQTKNYYMTRRPAERELLAQLERQMRELEAEIESQRATVQESDKYNGGEEQA